MIRIQRAFTAAGATLARVNATWKIYEQEQEDEAEVEEPDKFLKHDEARKVIENIDNYLLVKVGAAKVSLAYVVRDTVELPENVPNNAEPDPGFGRPDAVKEMIRRTRHDGDDYETDNLAVWELLWKVMHGGPGWNWIKTHARSRNGRAAYIAMKSHYFGTSYQSKIKSAADSTLDTIFFDGKARNFTFEKYTE